MADTKISAAPDAGTLLSTDMLPLARSGNASAFRTSMGAITTYTSAAIPAASSTLPTMDGTATIGVGTTWARADHIHPTDTSLSAATAANVGRNLIHNGLFNIQQRGVGPWTPNNSYTADRWYMSFTGGTLSTTIGTVNDTNRSQIGDEAAAFHLVASAAGGAGASDETFLQQAVEGVRRTAGKTVTLSFWAAATAGTPKLAILMYQIFGSGGSAPGVVPVQVVTLSTTYTRYSLTFSVPSAAGKTFGTAGTDSLFVRFGMSAGASMSGYGGIGQQSYVLALYGVQLEVGSVATPLEKPDPQQDLANCQRFYLAGIGAHFIGVAAVAAQYVGASVSLPVRMRAAPTVAWQADITSQTNCSRPTGDTIDPGGFRALSQATAGGNITTAFDVWFTASADL